MSQACRGRGGREAAGDLRCVPSGAVRCAYRTLRYSGDPLQWRVVRPSLTRSAVSSVLLALLLGACALAPVRTTLPAQWRPSPNFDQRRPNFIVIHHTSEDTAKEAIATLSDRAGEVSAHYVIGRDGTLYQLVDERLRAWH